MDLVTISEKYFTIFIGIFVTLAVMGTTTLYDRYKSKGGASFDPGEFELFSNLNSKMKTLSSGGLKHFSKYNKKISRLIHNKSDSNPKRSGSVQSHSTSNNFEKLGSIFLETGNAIQKFFASLSNKISSLSYLSSRSKKDEGNNISSSYNGKTDQKLISTDTVSDLDKAVKSKKEKLDSDDAFLTKIPTSGTLVSRNPETGVEGPFFGEMSSEAGESFDNDFIFDENEFAIKVGGRDDEPAGEVFSFNDNSAEMKFGKDSDDLLASLKKDIIITTEKKVNFMDSLQGEDLELGLIKSDLEGVLRELKKFRQRSSHN